jgi:hypothetical protein
MNLEEKEKKTVNLLSNQDKMEPKCFKSQIIVATCGGLLWNSKRAEVP